MGLGAKTRPGSVGVTATGSGVVSQRVTHHSRKELVLTLIALASIQNRDIEGAMHWQGPQGGPLHIFAM